MPEQPQRVNVVIDVVEEADAYRVVVRGVFEPGAVVPPLLEGAHRNVVQTWLGVPHDVRAFALGMTGG